jgi:hypothetical protein
MQSIGERFGMRPQDAQAAVHGYTRSMKDGHTSESLPGWVKLEFLPVKSYVPFHKLQEKVGGNRPPKEIGVLVSE